MSRVCRMLSVLSLLLLPALAWADVPPPPVKTVNEGKAPMNVVIDDKAKEPTLVIPQKMLTDWNKASKEEQSSLGISPLHTAFAGLALTGAFVFGGLWLVRYRGNFGGRGLAVLVGTIVMIGVCATAVLADRAPPGKPRPHRPGVEGIYLGEAKVQIVDNGDRVKLIISKEDLGKLTEKPKEKE